MNIQLFLTSDGITNNICPTFSTLFKDFLKTPELPFIDTAGDFETDRRYLEDEKRNLLNAGLKPQLLDLKRQNVNSLKKIINQTKKIYIAGGNTYYLLYWIRKSGLDKVLHSNTKPILYIGSSAGSIVAGPDIGLAGWRNLEEVNKIKLSSLEALNFVPFTISPHFLYTKKRIALIEKQKLDFPHPVICLKDKQAVAVTPNGQTIVGLGGKCFYF